jgi:hypothetical protein
VAGPRVEFQSGPRIEERMSAATVTHITPIITSPKLRTSSIRTRFAPGNRPTSTKSFQRKTETMSFARFANTWRAAPCPMSSTRPTHNIGRCD